MRPEIIPVDTEARPLLEALFQLYCYDFSEILGLDVGDDGRFPGPALGGYFTDPRRHAFLIRVDGKPAGFALVNEGSRLSGDASVRDMAEFFVMRRYRRQGVGEGAAHLLFDRFRGRWEVREKLENTAGTAFWRRIIARYTAGRFEDCAWDDERWRGPVQRFDAGISTPSASRLPVARLLARAGHRLSFGEDRRTRQPSSDRLSPTKHRPRRSSKTTAMNEVFTLMKASPCWARGRSTGDSRLGERSHVVDLDAALHPMGEGLTDSGQEVLRSRVRDGLRGHAPIRETPHREHLFAVLRVPRQRAIRVSVAIRRVLHVDDAARIRRPERTYPRAHHDVQPLLHAGAAGVDEHVGEPVGAERGKRIARRRELERELRPELLSPVVRGHREARAAHPDLGIREPLPREPGEEIVE